MPVFATTRVDLHQGLGTKVAERSVAVVHALLIVQALVARRTCNMPGRHHRCGSNERPGLLRTSCRPLRAGHRVASRQACCTSRTWRPQVLGLASKEGVSALPVRRFDVFVLLLSLEMRGREPQASIGSAQLQRQHFVSRVAPNGFWTPSLPRGPVKGLGADCVPGHGVHCHH